MEEDDANSESSAPAASSSSILNPQAGTFLPTPTSIPRPDPQSAPYTPLDPTSHAFQPGSSVGAGDDFHGPEDEGAQVGASTDYSRQSEIVQQYETTEEDIWEAESYIDPQDGKLWQRVAGADGLWESIRRCPNSECDRGFHFMWQTYDEKSDRLVYEKERCSVEGRDADERRKIQRNKNERKRRIEAFRARRQAGSEEAKSRYPVSRDLPAFLKTRPLRNSALRREVALVAPPKEDSFAYGLPRGLRPGQSWADDDDDEDDENNDDDYDGGDENDRDDDDDVDDSEAELDSGFWPVAKTTAARPLVERSEASAKDKAEYVDADERLLTVADRLEGESVRPPDQQITLMASGEVTSSLPTEEAITGASRPGEQGELQHSEAARQDVAGDSEANIDRESSGEFGAASEYKSQNQTSPQLTFASGIEGMAELTPSTFTTGQQRKSPLLESSFAATMDTPSDGPPQGHKDWKTLYELARQDIHRFLANKFNTTRMAEANTKLDAERAELKAFLRDDFDADTIAEAREQLAEARSERAEFLAHFRTDNFEDASRSLLNMIEHMKILKETNELLEDATKKTEIAEHKVRSLERENERLKLAQQNIPQETSRGRSPTRKDTQDPSEVAARDRDLDVEVALDLLTTAEIIQRMNRRIPRLQRIMEKWKDNCEEHQRRIRQIRDRNRKTHETTQEVVKSPAEYKEEASELLQGAKESINEVKETLLASDKQNELYETRAGKSDEELKAELEAVCEEYTLNVDKVMGTSETCQLDSDSDESAFVDAAEVTDETG